MRRTGRAERTEDPMPHVMSDVLVVLKPDRAGDLEDAGRRDARGARERARASRCSSRRRSACASTRGSAARRPTSRFASSAPISTSWRGSAPRRRRSWRTSRASRTCASRPSTGLPQLRVAIDRDAVARTGLTPGDVVRALRIGLVGEEVSEVWVGQRRYDLVVRLADPARNSVGGDPRPAARSARRHARPDRAGGARRRSVRARARSGARRAAGASPSKASVAGRDLGGAAAEVRERLAAELRLPDRVLRRRRRPRRAAGARDAVADDRDCRRAARGVRAALSRARIVRRDRRSSWRRCPTRSSAASSRCSSPARPGTCRRSSA